MPWHDGLDVNSTAYQVAADTSLRIRVISGPGTGKSFALQRRVARLLEEGANPRRILPVTFTRVAAEDLHRELVSLDVGNANALQGRTLHSLGLRILLRNNVLMATGRVARPLDQFEVEPLLYDLPRSFGNKNARKGKIRAYEAAWARLQHEEPGYAMAEEDARFELALLSWLRFHGAMLLGEIIPVLYRYLRNNPIAPEHQMFDHVLADEYQDLNKAEQRVLEMLSAESALCIVGDDDQSIYRFKFAHPEGIRLFHEQHEDTTDHQLLVCRRCPVTVVEMGNSLIGHNIDRDGNRELTPILENGPGDVRIRQYASLEHQTLGVVSYIHDLLDTEAIGPGDILVLAQRRVIGNPIIENLQESGIDTKSYYRESAIDSWEAKERLAIFKLLINQDDRVALRWLLGLHHAEFHTKQYGRIREYCEQADISISETLERLINGIIRIPHTSQICEQFLSIRSELERLSEISVDNFIEYWLPEHLEGIDELRALAADIEMGNLTLEDLLEAIETEIVQPEVPLEVDYVRVMSLHKSKGLSSPVVVIAGCVDGLLPAEPGQEVSDEERRAILEEQRRLLYVALTRVKAMPERNIPGYLLITNFLTMELASAMQANIQPAYVRRGVAYVNASRFIAELGPSAPQPERG